MANPFDWPLERFSWIRMSKRSWIPKLSISSWRSSSAVHWKKKTDLFIWSAQTTQKFLASHRTPDTLKNAGNRSLHIWRHRKRDRKEFFRFAQLGMMLRANPIRTQTSQNPNRFHFIKPRPRTSNSGSFNGFSYFWSTQTTNFWPETRPHLKGPVAGWIHHASATTCSVQTRNFIAANVPVELHFARQYIDRLVIWWFYRKPVGHIRGQVARCRLSMDRVKAHDEGGGTGHLPSPRVT